MAVKYDLYPNPTSGDSGYHARIITDGTTETNVLTQEIQTQCSLTKSDIYATLAALSDSLAEHLKRGERVHIDGLGYFQITLDITPNNENKKIRAEHVQFKTITFRPEQELKNKLATLQPVRNDRKHQTLFHSEREIHELLIRFFKSNDYLTRNDFEQLCNFTRSTAHRRLKELVNRGFLRKEGTAYAPFYTLSAG